MKVLNFTRKRALPGLLDGSKTLTIRPGFDVNNLEKIVETPPDFTISQKARLVWKWHSDSLYYCRECGERGYNQDGQMTEHEDCENLAPFNKYIGVATVSEIHQIKGGYWLKTPSPYFDGEYNYKKYFSQKETDETRIYRVPWFNKKYDLISQPKPFWVYVLKDFERC